MSYNFNNQQQQQQPLQSYTPPSQQQSLINVSKSSSSICADTNQQPLFSAYSSTENVIYKGWILFYQDFLTNSTPDLAGNSDFSNLKWVPKYVIVNKLDKSALLYDYEPTNEIIDNHYSTFVINNLRDLNSNENDFKAIYTNLATCYRLDNSIRSEQFLNFWRNHTTKFDLDKNIQDNYYSFYNMTKFNSNIQHSDSYKHHHLSNKDIEQLDKDSLSSFSTIPASSSSNSNETNGSNQPTGHGTFRFAGLFFKKDKSDKSKHSSLKRAKSGIQLERKKNSPQNGNEIKAVENSTPSNNDIENKNNLPASMRPSRSHESLSSPMKGSIRLNQVAIRNNSIYQQHLTELNNNNKSKFVRMNPSSSSMKPYRLSHPTTPSAPSKNKENETNPSESTGSSKTQTQIVDSIIKISFSNENSLNGMMNSISKLDNNNSTPINVCSVHSSLLNEENCFEIKCNFSTITVVNTPNNIEKTGNEPDEDFIERDDEEENEIDNFGMNLRNQQLLKYYASDTQYTSLYFMCRSNEEKEKWIQCLRGVIEPNFLNNRRDENSLQLWILEAKGQAISSKPNKKYFCQVMLNNTLFARTCCKLKKEILFWGENFDFNNIQCDFLRVEVYQETTDTQKKKSKKEKDFYNSIREKDSNIYKDYANIHNSNQKILGYVNIPVSSIESSQPVEKWYKLEGPLSGSSNDANLGNSGVQIPGGNTADTLSQSSSNQIMAASLTTTQNFSKDSISIRIKAKYQNVDILPLYYYQRLVEYIQTRYLELMLTLEPHLSVRIKDDLANSMVRIAHKLKIQTKFLTDLVLELEVKNSDDTSLTFRGNSLATKAMESYMKLVGEHYLKQTLSDCVRSIIDTCHDLEIDPSKVTNQSSLQANREELVQILHLVCGRVFNSCIHFPNEMKQVFARLRTECKENGKSDEMCDTLISASIFLRFICPAILSPNLFNLTQEYPQEKAARKLTLAAKTLQTIANFSKFGGKEFYMSFDKMNSFVNEHTILMREFLRKISTLTDEDLIESEQESLLPRHVAPMLSLTPTNTPPFVISTPTITSTNSQHPELSRKKTKLLTNQEINFDLELIDLGKQLSILHNLLNSIYSTLDETTKSKIGNELIEILEELNDLKKNKLTSISNPNFISVQNISSNNCNNNNNNNNINGTANVNPNASVNNKLYSYENRLHYALLKNNQQSLPMSPLTPNSNISDSLVKNNQNSSSSSSSSRYSSQLTLNIINGQNENLNNKVQGIENGSIDSQNKLENEINLLKLRLRETEMELKKEQAEKFSIEYKLNQQQHDNDQQMRNIINRLIKVEEELRKEQAEMHKLLKAKQDLIEIQKKRIEYLTNRASTSGSTPYHPSSTLASNNINLNKLNNQQPLHTNYQTVNYNQYAHQPKIRQPHRSQIKTQTSITPSASNPSIHTTANITSFTASDYSNIRKSNMNLDNELGKRQEASSSPTHDNAKLNKPGGTINEKPLTSIAASPSSSSASMTQFCSYLANNGLKGSNNNLNLDQLQKSKSKANIVPLAVVDHSSSSTSSSSSSSSSSAISSLSSNQNQHLSQSLYHPEVNFLRTSEL